ncbi:uncharacterized protein LOC108599898 [Drosophila busckii]|uniref:uncharacterized protein LOC108599898 n=1 Tax=Drosophila busckii TaxID=30019 RepID=UPI0014332783|nr:uncharacterized protein LOC108599898 [Drosophila busckii]
MRIKEYPEIVFDVIPKLYEQQTKVFITNLCEMEQQLERLPKKLCKMYTTRPLAEQLFLYLSTRHADITKKDFHIVQDSEPFKLQLSTGHSLQVMFCAGSELGNTLMVLIRKAQGPGVMLYYYSAVQQFDLCRSIRNANYIEWIREGTELILLNLQQVEAPFRPVDYDEIARNITAFNKAKQAVARIKLPLFGYEQLVKKLAATVLRGQIELLGSYAESYSILCTDTPLRLPNHVVRLQICARSEWNLSSCSSFQLYTVNWSPVPHRVNLIQLCSLLRPLHINGIVGYHTSGYVPPVPDYIESSLKLGNSPKLQLPTLESLTAQF